MTRNVTCRELIDVLDDYLAGSLPADVRECLERHLSGCAPCRDYLATYRDTIRLGKGASLCDDAAAPAAMPQELIDAIMDAMKRKTD